MKIVFASLEKLDFRNTLENVSLIESVEQLKNATNEDTTYVLAESEEYLKIVGDSKNAVYIPFTELTADYQRLGWHVYFDLENYPFYQKVKEMVEKDDKPKGVLRFRRMVNQYENNSILTGDLYVLSSLLGKAQGIQVKKTDQSVIPTHTIILMDFGEGTMAHIEYTVAEQERIEFEWSGIKTIIEFDSDQMRPIQRGSQPPLPLAYSVDAILASAQKVDQELVNQMNYFSKLINGGDHL
ncbi:hypothetical protein FQ087_04075 [Sporosarcina sp. ANT_H38]|uniref:hypothetical protein n=1 Tax=Sporosarcina sp. ANT_H38 TaxID=2597358 RepID=UPI0011F25676|nr:hypothetical protein [Sporosarcina sp. ANT_H38]KAA0965489.1 hypothetical protein FQ087_04075 [Sporosarcina sp. ANT_H38]